MNVINPFTICREEASRYLSKVLNVGITAAKLKILVERDLGPEFRIIGERIFFSKESLDAWIAEQLAPRQVEVRLPVLVPTRKIVKKKAL